MSDPWAVVFEPSVSAREALTGACAAHAPNWWHTPGRPGRAVWNSTPEGERDHVVLWAGSKVDVDGWNRLALVMEAHIDGDSADRWHLRRSADLPSIIKVAQEAQRVGLGTLRLLDYQDAAVVVVRHVEETFNSRRPERPWWEGSGPYVEEYEGSWYLVTSRHAGWADAVHAAKLKAPVLWGHRRSGRTSFARWVARELGARRGEPYRFEEWDLFWAIRSGRLYDVAEDSAGAVVSLRIEDALPETDLSELDDVILRAWGLHASSSLRVLFHASPEAFYRLQPRTLERLQQVTIIPHFTADDLRRVFGRFGLDQGLVEDIHQQTLGHPEWCHRCVEWLRINPGPRLQFVRDWQSVRDWLLDRSGPLAGVWEQLEGAPLDPDLVGLLAAVTEGDVEAVGKTPMLVRQRALTRGLFDLSPGHPVHRLRPIVKTWFALALKKRAR